MLWTEFLVFMNFKIKIKIKTTFRCDLKCPYCCIDIAEGRQSEFEELSVDEWLEIINNFPIKVGILILIGGEPFFRKDCAELINALTDQKIIVKVITNQTYKRMLDVKPTPFVKFLSTYHHHTKREKWLAFYQQLKKEYRTKIYEVENQEIKGSEVLKLVCSSDDGCYYRRDFIFTPNGELNMCIMDTCGYVGYQPKKKWEIGTPEQSYSIYSFKEKINLMFIRNLKYRLGIK